MFIKDILSIDILLVKQLLDKFNWKNQGAFENNLNYIYYSKEKYNILLPLNKDIYDFSDRMLEAIVTIFSVEELTIPVKFSRHNLSLGRQLCAIENINNVLKQLILD